jgi:hypothetical protein
MLKGTDHPDRQVTADQATTCRFYMVGCWSAHTTTGGQIMDAMTADKFEAADRPTFDLPSTWLAGWVGGEAIQATRPTIYVGCDPEGRISS